MSRVDEVKPFITEEQAAQLRQAVADAFRPLADSAKQMAAAYVNAVAKVFRDAVERVSTPEDEQRG